MIDKTTEQQIHKHYQVANKSKMINAVTLEEFKNLQHK